MKYANNNGWEKSNVYVCKLHIRSTVFLRELLAGEVSHLIIRKKAGTCVCVLSCEHKREIQVSTAMFLFHFLRSR